MAGSASWNMPLEEIRCASTYAVALKSSRDTCCDCGKLSRDQGGASMTISAFPQIDRVGDVTVKVDARFTAVGQMPGALLIVEVRDAFEGDSGGRNGCLSLS
jgi:hypothetical protein